MKKIVIVVLLIISMFLVSGCNMSKFVINKNTSDKAKLLEEDEDEFDKQFERLKSIVANMSEDEEKEVGVTTKVSVKEDEEPKAEEPEVVEEPEVTEVEEPEVVEEEPVEEVKETPKSDKPQVVVNEGDLVKLNLKATDPDGDTLTYSFTEPLDSKGEWQTDSGDAGVYPVTITVSDGKLTTKQAIEVVVNAVNHAPVLKVIKEIDVNEGDTLLFKPEVSDIDGDDVKLKYSGWMSSAKYTIKKGDAGTHTVTITANDGNGGEDTADVKVIVSAVNEAPVIKIDDVTVTEGDKITLAPSISDPEGDEVEVSYSGWMTSSTYTTTSDDAGEYTVTITATDSNGLSATADVKVTVEDLNRPPEIIEITLG